MRSNRSADIWSRTRTTRRVAAGLVTVILLVVGVVAADAIRRHIVGEAELATDPSFYSLPDDLPRGGPGELIRIEEIASAPLGTRAWRVIHHSTDLHGDDIPVSGVVIVPDTPAPPDGRTVVAWGHPTTGAATQCAPSLGVDPFRFIEGMHEILAEGHVIAATDYPGLGVEGASSYLLGIPESNSMLDLVRAARLIDGADAGDRVILWGHSQGGQAALFAAERAADYAPELTLLGVAVAAPAAELGELMSDDIGDVSGVTIASYAIPAFEAAYADRYPDGQISAILTPAGAAATPKMAALCLLSQNSAIHAIAEPLVSGYVTSDPSTTEPWKTLLAENSAGTRPLSVPVFVGQGLADELVRPEATEDYVTRLCGQRASVEFHRYPDVDHGLAAYASLPDVLLWMAVVNGGGSPRSTCG